MLEKLCELEKWLYRLAPQYDDLTGEVVLDIGPESFGTSHIYFQTTIQHKKFYRTNTQIIMVEVDIP